MEETREYSPEYIGSMVGDTTSLLQKEYVETLIVSGNAAINADALSTEVEFWKWMNRNFSKSGIFHDSKSMANYINQTANKARWFNTQVQGKGFEWDWMTENRHDIHKIFNIYDAGDVSNRVGSDVTETNFLTHNSQDYQMKAYTSKNNPKLKNTQKDNIVVTNSEKVDGVQKQGYQTESYKSSDEIIKDRDNRVNGAVDGSINTNYNLKNMGQVAGSAALVGCVVGIGMETIKSYGRWKKGEIDSKEYMEEIVKTGGEQAITGGASAVIMVPVTAKLTVAGASALYSFPIGFLVGSSIEYIVAPAFGRGVYKEQLDKAFYYKDINEAYYDLAYTMQLSQENYYRFLLEVSNQTSEYEHIKQLNISYDEQLNNLIDKIRR